MVAVVALLAVVVAQIGLWALLRAGVFMEALAAGVLFWSLAFPSWVAAGRRWWRSSATPDVALSLTIILLTAASFFASGGLADAAYCGGVSPENDHGCWISPPSQDAFSWFGVLNAPIALIAAALATVRTRALRADTDLTSEVRDTKSGPGPVTPLVIGAVIVSVALVVLVLLIIANAGRTRL
jgi:hypothetical protein